MFEKLNSSRVVRVRFEIRVLELYLCLTKLKFVLPILRYVTATMQNSIETSKLGKKVVKLTKEWRDSCRITA